MIHVPSNANWFGLGFELIGISQPSIKGRTLKKCQRRAKKQNLAILHVHVKFGTIVRNDKFLCDMARSCAQMLFLVPNSRFSNLEVSRRPPRC